MAERILVINPNSSELVTAEIAQAIQHLVRPHGPAIECVTLVDGPEAVQTQSDVETAVAGLCHLVRREKAIAYVVACYSDPGIHVLREISSAPVLGIGECSMMVAMMRGELFGIIAILPASVQRQQRNVRMMGLDSRYAGSCAINLGVRELADDLKVLPRILEAGRWLRDERQASVIILGCAGMAGYRKRLEEELGVPVVEPSQAAVAMALGLAALSGDSAGSG